MKRIGFIILALVIALGALGAGYAAWSKTVTVNGQVLTGYVNAEFANSDGPVGPFGPYDSVTCTVSGDGKDKLTLDIQQAYPGIVIVAPYQIKNTGTVPMNQAWGDITESVGDGSPGALTNFTVSSSSLPREIGPNGGTSGGQITIVVGPYVESEKLYTITMPIVCSMVPVPAAQ
jgi:hypothetical protein